MHLLAETEAADADDCYTDNHGCSSDNHHDNQHCKIEQKDIFKFSHGLTIDSFKMHCLITVTYQQH